MTDPHYASHAITADGRCLTIAGVLRRWLAWEWTLWIAGCLWLLMRLGIAPGWTLLIAPASWLLSRWLVFVGELLAAMTLRHLVPAALRAEADEPRAGDLPATRRAARAVAHPGPLALLRCITVEARHWLFSFVLGQAFAWRAPAPLPRDNTGPVVLLVHGFGCNGTIWRHVAARLAAEGYRVETIDMLPVFGPIELYVDQLHARIEQICARRGCTGLLAVGHSMGGIALRAYAARHGNDRLARLVTLGSPHRGTWFAHFFVSPNVRQMRLDSDFLRALAEAETGMSADRICLWSRHDNVVTPQLSARLPGARSVMVEGIGHLSLICEPRGVALLASLLAESGHEAVLADSARAVNARRAAP